MVYGHWKDTGIRMHGEAVSKLTKMFITDYALNFRKIAEEYEKYYCISEKYADDGFLIPFGSGPRPIYNKEVGKAVIMNMLNQAKRYVYITTPYTKLRRKSKQRDVRATECPAAFFPKGAFIHNRPVRTAVVSFPAVGNVRSPRGKTASAEAVRTMPQNIKKDSDNYSHISF